MVAEQLGLGYVVVTADQAIYDIIKGLQAKYTDKYSKLILRLGGFHMAENFMKAIGYFMKQSGYEDVLVSSGVASAGIADKVTNGKDYYQMLRCFTLTDEAVTELLWEAFQQWNQSKNGASTSGAFHRKLSELNTAMQFGEDIRHKAHQALADLKETVPRWEEYIAALPATGKLWLQFHEIVTLLKRYIHAERSGDWNAHLNTVSEIYHTSCLWA
jgi:hypothetical protein